MEPGLFAFAGYIPSAARMILSMRVAITGGIAEGKSTVLELLREMGHSVASSDAVAREVRARPETALALAQALQLAELPSRDTLRELLSRDPLARRAVNRVLHPLIVREIESGDARFVEVPLLFEAVRYGAFDRVWVVTCGEDEQMARLRMRYGEAEARRIVATQLPTEAKLAFADEIIRTNTPVERVKQVVCRLVADMV